MKKIRSLYHRLSPVRTGPFPHQDVPGVTHVPIHDEMHGFDLQQLDSNASAEQVAEFLAAPPMETFESFVSGMRLQIVDELAASGLPPPDRYILVSGDSWRLAPDSMLADPFADHPECGPYSHFCLGTAYIYATVPMFSRPWFLTQLAEALLCLAEVSGDGRDWAIFRFGRLLEQLEHRVHHANVRIAAKNRRGAALGGRASATLVKVRTDRVLTEMRKLVGKGHSIARAAALCAGRGIGTSQAANVQLWKRHK